MYIDWFDAFLNNLHAERLGIWKDYPDSLRGMVPFDAAANRRTYTKLVVWFLDDLEDLDEATFSKMVGLLFDDLLNHMVQFLPILQQNRLSWLK